MGRTDIAFEVPANNTPQYLTIAPVGAKNNSIWEKLN